MKTNLLIILSFVLLIASCNRSRVDVNKNEREAFLYIPDSIQTFGVVSKSSQSEQTCFFELKNIGDIPIMIQNISVSCGCLSCEIPKKTVMPAESMVLPVKIDLKNQLGSFNKSLVVFSNAVEPKIIRIKGQITK